MLSFKPITLNQKSLIDSYLFKYGEGSCQHSFVSMYCMITKYMDLICEKDGWLFVLRAGKCTDTERRYLFPFGNYEDRDGLKKAIGEIMEDAHCFRKSVRFETITKKSSELLEELFPGQFEITDMRDYYEYIYSNDKLANLPGHEMASKRHDIKTYFRDFGDRTEVRVMTEDDIPGIYEFQKRWLEEKMARDFDPQLDCENNAIMLGLDNFKDLNISGIVVLIDGEIKGYAYGAPLSDTVYDVIIEKGDREYPDIYKILNRDLVRLCCGSFAEINREEDVGVEGLRKAKLSYKPDRMIEKFIAREVISQ